MSEYKKDLAKTIDTVVGGRFDVIEGTASHVQGRLSYPHEAFKLVSTDKRSFSRVGVTGKSIYNLEAIKSGSYEIEYQHLQPGPPSQLDKAAVVYAVVYKVNVK